jgi:hypothetical protein
VLPFVPLTRDADAQVARLAEVRADEATGEPPEAILQRLAILAEHWRGTPPAG